MINVLQDILNVYNLFIYFFFNIINNIIYDIILL